MSMNCKNEDRFNNKNRPIKREELEKFEGKLIIWRVQIGRRGNMPLFRGRVYVPTVLLTNVCSRPSGFYVSDHVWMLGGAWLSDFQEGDCVEFCGRVCQYGNGEGYALWEPQDVKRI